MYSSDVEWHYTMHSPHHDPRDDVDSSVHMGIFIEISSDVQRCYKYIEHQEGAEIDYRDRNSCSSGQLHSFIWRFFTFFQVSVN